MKKRILKGSFESIGSRVLWVLKIWMAVKYSFSKICKKVAENTETM